MYGYTMKQLINNDFTPSEYEKGKGHFTELINASNPFKLDGLFMEKLRVDLKKLIQNVSKLYYYWDKEKGRSK